VVASNPAHHRGYSLSTLFLLIAACAVAIGMVSPVLRGEAQVGPGDVIGSAIACGLMGLILGAVVGLFHYSRVRGLGWGLIVGGLIGAVCGPIMYVPPAQFSFVFSTALGGAVLILGVAAMIRMTSAGGLDATGPPDAQVTEDGIVVAEVVPQKPHPLDPD
jgi:hypothetical protein